VASLPPPDAQQGGLARPVRAHDRDALPGRNGDVDRAEREALAIPAADAGEREQGWVVRIRHDRQFTTPAGMLRGRGLNRRAVWYVPVG
jgi:hypothetical protein